MWRESEQYKNALIYLGINYIILDADSANRLRQTIYIKFTKNRQYLYPLWEQLTDFKGVIFDFAWEWFSELLKDDEVIVFFEEANDKSVFVLNNGGVIPEIMNECPAMTFYVTNTQAEFLYAYHSDHSIFRVSGNVTQKFEDYIVSNNINVSIYSTPSRPRM